MVLQEEKLVWRTDLPDMPYLSPDDEPRPDAMDPDSKLNMAVMCNEWPELRRYMQAYAWVKDENPLADPETIYASVGVMLQDPDYFPVNDDDKCAIGGAAAEGDFPAQLLEVLSWRQLKLRINDVQLINFPKELNTPGCLGAVINYFEPSIQNHYCAVIKYPNSPYQDRPYAIGESLNDPPITYYSFDGLMCALQRLGHGNGPIHITCIYADNPDSLRSEASARMMALGEEWNDEYLDDAEAYASAQRETTLTVNAAKRGIMAGRQSVDEARKAVLKAAANNAAAENEAETAAEVASNAQQGSGRKTRKHRKRASRTRSKRRR